jgi:outer membrane receptor protein involved in Fe transport
MTSPNSVTVRKNNVGLDVRQGPFSAGIVSKMYQANANNTVNWEVFGVQDEIPFITDVTARYNFLKNFNLSLTVANLFDSQYFLYNRAPGRSAFGMLTAKF